jgi:serine/threonine protein kinase
MVGIPRLELLGYLLHVAEHLDTLHARTQQQHLDIKPTTLFYTGEQILLPITGPANGVTPVYAAPETFEGIVTSACDQYSLACVYQEMLTGRRPFTGDNVCKLVIQHISGQPDLTPLPPADRPIVGRALAKHPGDRYASCTAFIVALRPTAEA